MIRIYIYLGMQRVTVVCECRFCSSSVMNHQVLFRLDQFCGILRYISLRIVSNIRLGICSNFYVKIVLLTYHVCRYFRDTKVYMKVKIICYINLLMNSIVRACKKRTNKKMAGTCQIKTFKSRPLYPRDSQPDKKFRAATVIKLLFP